MVPENRRNCVSGRLRPALDRLEAHGVEFVWRSASRLNLIGEPTGVSTTDLAAMKGVTVLREVSAGELRRPERDIPKVAAVAVLSVAQQLGLMFPDLNPAPKNAGLTP